MMERVQPFDNGTRWASAVKYLVALPYLYAPLAYWAYQLSQGHTPDMLIWVLVLMLTLVSSYLVFGKAETKDALGEAKDAVSGDGE